MFHKTLTFGRLYLAVTFMCFGFLLLVPKGMAIERGEVIQPIHEYNISFKEEFDGDDDLNPFRFYTHLGTNYGLIGPEGENLGEQLRWVDGKVHALPIGQWKGMFHTLAGTTNPTSEISERDATLDFERCYPAFIRPRFQPSCVGLRVRIRGTGRFKLEIKRLDNSVAVDRTWVLDSPNSYVVKELRFRPSDIGQVKLVNWVAEQDANVWVDRLDLILRFPVLSWDERAFLVSYAKLARCYSEKFAIVKDRAQWPVGDFDSVPASGLFCLATCAAMDLGIVSKDFATETFQRVRARVSLIDGYQGVLPHFVEKIRNQFVIHPGTESSPPTEFSTVDTSIYYHAMLLSAEILRKRAHYNLLFEDMQAATFDDSFYRRRFIIHGFRIDGQPLASAWRDWGGETAIVLLWESLVLGDAAKGRMDDDGTVYCGVGFIPEIASLFYPDFDLPIADLFTGQNWLAIRRGYLQRQINYFRENYPQSAARRLGLYGLSAGEGANGLGYSVNGVDCEIEPLIHPHYILLTGSLRNNPANMCILLRKLERGGLFPAWGLVENVGLDTRQYLPMLGSLNASFESIGAYHMWAKYNGEPDIIYQASLRNRDFRNAANIFYGD